MPGKSFLHQGGHIKAKVRTPNAEQRVAIDHFGGKILSAGAGSGKTFVIIEHIVHILSDLQKEIPQNDWNVLIPQKMNRLVLMTFTKKAAGEMSIRMMNKLDELASGEEGDFWSIVRQNLASLNIMTISSFCNGLISQGYIKNLPRKVEIVSALEHKDKIKKIFDGWFDQHQEKLNQVMQANSQTLISAMVEIFNSPELRLIWKEALPSISADQELDLFFSEMLIALELEEVFTCLESEIEEDEKKKGWYIFLQAFEQIVQQHGPLNGKNAFEYLQFSRSCGRLPVAPKSLDERHKEHLVQVKELVTFLRSIDEDIVHFVEYFDVCDAWTKTLKDLFDFIEGRYLDIPGFCFADLEYYVSLGLKDTNARNAVNAQYDYFIVDEFQDTSFVQYAILKELIGHDSGKLFCVGDKKQAIYGFRGGELQVFNECISFLGAENNIWLKNNFRSSSAVISFNNHFFDMVFPLGLKFEGQDKYSVQMEPQLIPGQAQTGIVERIETMLMGTNDSKDIDVDYYEALAIKSKIDNLLSDDNFQSICVLYRKLKPSAFLLDLLASDNCSYTAQVKVQYAEDPVINLFLRLIETKLNKNNENKLEATRQLFNLQCSVMGIKTDFEKISATFLGQIDIIGLRLAFHKTIYSMGLNNSLYSDNSALIDSICNICQNSPELAYTMLTSENEQQYSLNSIKVGKGKRVIIMSAHASKGLEYDAVILGGIHSNGNMAGKTAVIGKMPRSFRWKKSFNQKKFFKSPAYFLEAEVEKAKDFSESKRLLYVACTRAIKYLGWIDLNYLKDQTKTELDSGANHWIKALRLALDSSLIQNSSIELAFKSENKRVEQALLLKDSMGIKVKEGDSSLGVIAETSVTRLAHLVQCPHKFYLSNIVKLEPENANALPSANAELDFESDEEIFYSSKKRGIELHQWLSDIITGRKVFNDYQGSDSRKLQWALLQSDRLKNYQIHSEELVKFSLFGQMVSGTPDIVFLKNDEIVIWDFKTGQRDEKNEGHYWFQLFCYGLAYFNLKQFTPEKKVVLALLYLDEEKLIQREISGEEINESLFGVWQKTDSLHQVNLNHCFSCEYSSICHKNATSSP